MMSEVPLYEHPPGLRRSFREVTIHSSRVSGFRGLGLRFREGLGVGGSAGTNHECVCAPKRQFPFIFEGFNLVEGLRIQPSRFGIWGLKLHVWG